MSTPVGEEQAPAEDTQPTVPASGLVVLGDANAPACTDGVCRWARWAWTDPAIG
jgi:hypothetical protein